MTSPNPKKFPEIFYILLVVGLGIIILLPTLDYQPFLSQGDHGLNLYNFRKAIEGQKPYIDYWWNGGPLMPYYYGLFYLLCGINIHSVLIGKMALTLTSALLTYQILTLTIAPIFALLGAVWFLLFGPDFFYSYNHPGGVTAILAVVYCAFLYLKKQDNKYLAAGLLCVFVVSLIKINFGFSSLMAFVFSVFIVNLAFKRPPKTLIKFYIAALVILPAIILLIYFLLLSPLPLYALRQCMPYFPGYDPSHITLLKALHMLLNMTINNISSNLQNLCFAVLIIASLIQIGMFMADKKAEQNSKKQLLVSLMIPAAFYIVNLHEFLKSGVLYRFFWAQPMSILLIFIVIGHTGRKMSPLIRSLMVISISTIALMRFFSVQISIDYAKNPNQYLNHPRGGIFVGNSPVWIDTVLKTTRFLQNTLNPKETFLAIPYDPLYYFLTDRTSPSRQTIFFEYINIPEEQERTIIAELETKHVNWILLSSRSQATEPGLGIFGITYCPLLGQYLEKNFKPVAQFGDWENEPGWAWNHGTVILKRVGE